MFDIILKDTREKHAQHSDRDLLYIVLANQFFIIQKLQEMAKQAEVLETAVSGLEKAVQNIPATGNPDALTNEEAQAFADRVTAATASIPQNPPPAEPAP